MTIKSKIKGLIAIKSVNITKYAEFHGTTKQNMHRTLTRDTIKVNELLQLCAYTGCHLAIIDDKTNKEIIGFNDSDLKEQALLNILNDNKKYDSTDFEIEVIE